VYLKQPVDSKVKWLLVVEYSELYQKINSEQNCKACYGK